MSDLKQNSIQYLQKKFPRATVLSEEFNLNNQYTGDITKVIVVMIAQDWTSGTKQRLATIPNLGANDELLILAKGLPSLFEKLDTSIFVASGNVKETKEHEMNSNQMVNAPRMLIYTDVLRTPYQNVLDAFGVNNILIEVVHESEMYNTLFISYGDPDKEYAILINDYLKEKGIKTWFFSSDSLPGQKLHRVIHDGVNNHDRVLLVCSKNSLSRSGVLNEIERVLEREAREGGTTILIPITLDDYIYSEWKPERTDIVTQIRARVITKFPKTTEQTEEFIQAAEKLVQALSKKTKL